MFLYRPPYFPNYQFLIELKYLKKTQANKLAQITKDAKNQIKDYLALEEIKNLENLKSWVIVFVGKKAEVIEEV